MHHRRNADEELWSYARPRTRTVTLSILTSALLFVLVFNSLAKSGVIAGLGGVSVYMIVMPIVGILQIAFFWFHTSSATTVNRRGVRVRAGCRVTHATWDEVRNVRKDVDSAFATHLVADLGDGRELALPCVPMDSRDALVAWAPSHEGIE